MFVADYSWQHPTTDELKAAGYGAVMRYLARKIDAKLLQSGEAEELHAAGIGIGLVWETTAARAGEGAAAGLADANDAEALADRLGVPDATPIFYAVDFETSADVVRPYFAAILGAARRPVGVYGSYRVVEGLPEVPWVWQTVAWSYGRISERCHLYQKGSRLDGTDHNTLYRQLPFWIAGGQVMLINPVVGKITSAYSLSRVNPVTGVTTAHLGVDVAAPIGTPIKAPAAGKVKAVALGSYPGDPTTGRILPGRTGNGLYASIVGGAAIYLGHIDNSPLRAGDSFTAGQVIATVGNTGMSTGPHLHLEVHPYDDANTTDPVRWFASRGVVLGVDPYSVTYIKRVQELLNEVIEAGLVVDGDLGPRTVAAVTDFQASAGLVPDGDPGPITLRALLDAATPEEDIMTPDQAAALNEIRGNVQNIERWLREGSLPWIATLKAQTAATGDVDEAALAAQIAAAIPDTLAQAVADELAKRLAG